MKRSRYVIVINNKYLGRFHALMEDLNDEGVLIFTTKCAADSHLKYYMEIAEANSVYSARVAEVELKLK